MNRLATTAARSGRLLRSSTSLSARAASTSASATSVPATKESAVPTPKQAPNYSSTWSTSQKSRAEILTDARFEQTHLELQPQPLSAMEMIAQEPVRMVNGRIAECDGGKGPLGHPKIFINLDQPHPKPCGYCGLRFQQAHHH